MLKGVLKYNNDGLSANPEENIEMTLYAKDTGTVSLNMLYEGNSLVKETAVMTLFDSKLQKDGTFILPVSAEDFGDKSRRLNIAKGSKFQTNLQNMLFAARVSALFRYCDEFGKMKSDVELGFLEEREYASKFEFTVHDSDGNLLGTFVKNLGFLQEMHVKNKYVAIDLDYFDENELEVQMFTTLQLKDKYGNKLSKTPIKNSGFKFSEELLGFKYVPYCNNVQSTGTLLGLYGTMDEVIEAHPEKNFKWLRGRKYEIVTDETLEEVMKAYNDYDGIIGIDTETSGLGITFKSRDGHGDQLVGICMSMAEGTGHYFPLQMKYIKNLCDGDHWYFMERYMKKFLESHKFVTHNLAFDWKVFYIYDINLNAVFDTMIAYGVTERYKQANFEYGLKDLTHNLFGWDMIELSDMVASGEWGKGGDENAIRFWDLPYELVRNYAPTDADMTLTLYNYVQKIKLLESFKAEDVFKIELDYAKVVAYSEFYGYHIDVDRLPTMISEIENGKAVTEKKMYELAGREFNPNSSKVLAQIMFDELQIPDVSNKRSTGKEFLKELSDMTNTDGEPMYPFVRALKEYRDYEKIYTNFLKRKDEFMTEDGYIFPHVFAFGTNTGRCSVKEPNYQSYNDAVKKYVCPRTGYKMWDSDFSQIEYRVLCSMAHEPALIQSFSDPDMDYHTYQAARMFGVPYGAVTKQMRQQCKGINFGLPYGMGDSSLGARIFGARTPENTRKAANLRELYFEGQDNIRAFFDTVRDDGVANGFTRTKFGRRRYYHKSKFSEAQIRRQAGNHVIQGCQHGDTRIHTKEYGIVKLKDVVNAHVNVWNGTTWSEGNVVPSGQKQKCIVTFSDGSQTICSPIHKFLVVSHRGNMRWVEAKDLKGKEGRKVGYRVVINQAYEPSDFMYRSEYIKGTIPQHIIDENKPVFLDDIPDSFDKGVFLGRLSSDGSIVWDASKVNSSNRVVQIVAEHEYSILPELRRIMKNFKFSERVIKAGVGSREDRTQDLTRLELYSATLVEEIRALDIRHKIHPYIWQDTEMLRGFLRGLFDGDGGISGKTIMLVFGANDNYEPFCREIQQALLFFGVRSNYRKYEGNRYVIQIKTNDNSHFLDVIGFINPEKQAKGRALISKEDEHIFGPNLQITSVEITDEFVDMYDVCNTKDGYYMSNGVITHNTAADLYKLACNRVFHMLERRGWLGKVLLDGFIHDEILGEVSEDINFYEFVDEWRKAFEVPVEGFCKLYAGLGIGNSWYEAKKADWPPQLIEIIINSDRKNHWDNNGQAMIDWVKEAFHDYGVSRVVDYIKENIEGVANNTIAEKDRVIKPVIDAFLKEKLNWYYDSIDKNADIIKKHSEIVGYEITFNKKGVVLKDLQDWIKLFCEWQGLDYSKTDIRDASSAKVEDKSTENVRPEVNLDEMEADAFMLHSIKNNGFFPDHAIGVLYINLNMMFQTGMWEQFNSLFIKDSGTYAVKAVSFNTDGTYEIRGSNYYVMSMDLMLIQQFMQNMVCGYLSMQH